MSNKLEEIRVVGVHRVVENVNASASMLQKLLHCLINPLSGLDVFQPSMHNHRQFVSVVAAIGKGAGVKRHYESVV